MLVIHRPGLPDEVISAAEFHRRTHPIDADESEATPTPAGERRGRK